MKKNQNYDINFATNTITVTRKFLQDASQMGTEAFKTMKDLQALNMTIVERKINRKSPKVPKWTYKEMRNYLTQVENSESWLADFEALKKAVAHGVVWSWFKSNFKPIDEKGRRITPKLNTNHKIIVMPSTNAPKAIEILDKAKDNAPAAKGA